MNIQEEAFISLIEAGGKSSLFSLLAQELGKNNQRMIFTTTTYKFTHQLTPFLKTWEFIEFDDNKMTEERIKMTDKVNNKLREELAEQ